MRILALLPLVVLGGCDLIAKECNLMYAPDQLIVQIDGSYADGAHELEFLSDDGDVLCTFTVGPDSQDVQPECTGDTEEVFFELDADGGITSLNLWSYVPDSVVVVHAVDGVEAVSEVFDPTYDVDEPNGKGCGERRFGEITFEI